MTTLTSHKKLVSTSANIIFEFLNDFNNLEHLMPSKVVNWSSTPITCAFTIEGMAHMNMAFGKNIENEKVEMISKGKNPFSYELNTIINKVDEKSAEVNITFVGDMNPMFAMMAKKPLQDFVNVLVDRLQEKFS